jgi:hypothetical protein
MNHHPPISPSTVRATGSVCRMLMVNRLHTMQSSDQTKLQRNPQQQRGQTDEPGGSSAGSDETSVRGNSHRGFAEDHRTATNSRSVNCSDVIDDTILERLPAQKSCQLRRVVRDNLFRNDLHCFHRLSFILKLRDSDWIQGQSDQQK